MGLMQLNSEGWNKIETAVKVIQQNEPPEGYYVANSGGKDSGIIVDLCKRAGVKFDAHYNVSPIDPPEVYKFLKEHHPETQWDYYAKGFWNLVDKKGLPTRQSRWCCEVIKEGGGTGRTVITGIRWAESAKRSQRCMVESDRNDKTKKLLHAIICWNEAEVWEYYQITKIPYLSLYDIGWKRVGCIGCPMSNNQLKGLATYPKLGYLWKEHARIFFELHPNNKTSKALKTPDIFWNWWLSGKSVKAYLNEQQSKF